jgi:hypothetical protein
MSQQRDFLRALHDSITERHARHKTGGEMTDSKGLVQKLWSYCNVLRDDGLSYGDYIEQLTYLLFLKMADEQTALQPACIDPRGLGLAVPVAPRR